MKRREAEHLGRVAALGCALCRHLGYPDTPAQVHHLREGQGGAQRADWTLTIPLCPDHHTGKHGIHGDRADFKRASVGELDLLAETLAQVLR